MCQNIQVASAYGTREATVGLVLAVFGFEGCFHIPGETFAFGLAVGVIEEDVGLGAFAAAVYMDEDGPAVLEFLAILPVEGVDFIATLLKALYLVQRDGRAHAGFPFAVGQVGLVADTVFGILNDDAYLGTFLHQVACQAQGDVIGIFVFVKFVFTNTAYGTGVGAAVSADHIETGTGKAVGGYLDVSQPFSEQRFVDFRTFGRRADPVSDAFSGVVSDAFLTGGIR